MGDTFEIFSEDNGEAIERFEVRDMRARTRFFIDNVFYDKFVPVFGPSLSMVYIALVRHANREQKTWPSQTRIAAQLGMSRQWINVQLQLLEAFGLIKKVRVGKMCSNRYYLLDEKHWRGDFDDLLALAAMDFSIVEGAKKEGRKVMSSELTSVMSTGLGADVTRTLHQCLLEWTSNRKVEHSKVTRTKRKRTVVKKVEKPPTPIAAANTSQRFEYVFDATTKTMVERPIE
jgi:biotin operon repressor